MLHHSPPPGELAPSVRDSGLTTGWLVSPEMVPWVGILRPIQQRLYPHRYLPGSILVSSIPVEIMRKGWRTRLDMWQINLKRAILRAIYLSNSDIWWVQRDDSIWSTPGVGELPQATKFLLGKLHQDPIPYLQSWILWPLVIFLLVTILCLLDGSDSSPTGSSQHQNQLFSIILNSDRCDWIWR